MEDRRNLLKGRLEDGLSDFIEKKMSLVAGQDLAKYEAGNSVGPRPERGLDPPGWSLFRAFVGVWQWVTIQGRSDVGGKVGTLSNELASPKGGSITRANQITVELKSTAGQQMGACHSLDELLRAFVRQLVWTKAAGRACSSGDDP